MEKSFWLGRWERGETGWHQTEVEPALVANFSDLKPTRVLVPLCGKSLDLAWLAERGHEVIGVELSDLAIRAFFHERGIEFREVPCGELTRFEGGKITIFGGDFFSLRTEDLGKLGAVYDRAALIALPPETRVRYAEHLFGLLGESKTDESFRFLQILLQREPHDDLGPPHSVPEEELARLYGSRFTITPVSREEVGVAPSGARLVQTVFMLTWPR